MLGGDRDHKVVMSRRVVVDLEHAGCGLAQPDVDEFVEESFIIGEG